MSAKQLSWYWNISPNLSQVELTFDTTQWPFSADESSLVVDDHHVLMVWSSTERAAEASLRRAVWRASLPAVTLRAGAATLSSPSPGWLRVSLHLLRERVTREAQQLFEPADVQSLACRQCGAALLATRADALTFRRVARLPSDDWLEWSDLWHCGCLHHHELGVHSHAHDDESHVADAHDHHDHAAPEGERVYARPHKLIRAQRGVCLIGDGYLLLHAADCGDALALRPAEHGAPAAATCDACDAELGASQATADGETADECAEARDSVRLAMPALAARAAGGRDLFGAISPAMLLASQLRSKASRLQMRRFFVLAGAEAARRDAASVFLCVLNETALECVDDDDDAHWSPATPEKAFGVRLGRVVRVAYAVSSAVRNVDGVDTIDALLEATLLQEQWQQAHAVHRIVARGDEVSAVARALHASSTRRAPSQRAWAERPLRVGSLPLLPNDWRLAREEE